MVQAAVRFGIFEAKLSSGELWKHGRPVRVQSLPFKVLSTLLERPGQVVTRDELQRTLWGDEIAVDFDRRLGTAVNKLREALGDSAEKPLYIETLPKRGFRFIAPVKVIPPHSEEMTGPAAEPSTAEGSTPEVPAHAVEPNVPPQAPNATGVSTEASRLQVAALGIVTDSPEARTAQGRKILKDTPWLWAISTLVLLVLALVFSLARPRPPFSQAWTPEMEELWRPFLSSQRPIMVAIGTPLFVKIGNRFYRDPTLNTWDSAANARETLDIEHVTGANSMSRSFNYTGVGEAEGAFELGRLLLVRNYDLTLRASNELTWEDISRYNMIFLGPPKYIPQTLDLPIAQDFEIQNGRVQNLRPAPGEPQFYEEKWSDDRANLPEGHALISRLPGPHRTGEMLVLAGSSTEATRAAVEFVTRPEYVASLVRQMHNRGGIPEWFQLVIHVRYKSKTPIAMELVAMHALK
jgi:DNA-binding winged helix-turn-helix (wHTH) protein